MDAWAVGNPNSVADHSENEYRFCRKMTLTLPDDPALTGFSEPDLHLGLACGLFSGGAVSRGVAARIAGVDRAAFDEALFTRRIASYTDEMLDEDLSALKTLFPE